MPVATEEEPKVDLTALDEFGADSTVPPPRRAQEPPPDLSALAEFGESSIPAPMPAQEQAPDLTALDEFAEKPSPRAPGPAFESYQKRWGGPSAETERRATEMQAAAQARRPYDPGISAAGVVGDRVSRVAGWAAEKGRGLLQLSAVTVGTKPFDKPFPIEQRARDAAAREMTLASQEFGLPGAVAQTILDSAWQMAGELMLAKGATGMLPGGTTGAAGGWLANAKSVVKHAAKFAAYRFATMPGTTEERAKAAAMAFALSATPAISTGVPSDAMAKIVDIALNAGISTATGQYADAWRAARDAAGPKWATMTRTKRAMTIAGFMTPVALTDVLFALDTRSSTKGWRARLTPDQLKEVDAVVRPQMEAQDTLENPPPLGAERADMETAQIADLSQRAEQARLDKAERQPVQKFLERAAKQQPPKPAAATPAAQPRPVLKSLADLPAGLGKAVQEPVKVAPAPTVRESLKVAPEPAPAARPPAAAPESPQGKPLDAMQAWGKSRKLDAKADFDELSGVVADMMNEADAAKLAVIKARGKAIADRWGFTDDDVAFASGEFWNKLKLLSTPSAAGPSGRPPVPAPKGAAVEKAVALAQSADPANMGSLLGALQQAHRTGATGPDAVKAAWSLYAASSDKPAIGHLRDFVRIVTPIEAAMRPEPSAVAPVPAPKGAAAGPAEPGARQPGKTSPSIKAAPASIREGTLPNGKTPFPLELTAEEVAAPYHPVIVGPEGEVRVEVQGDHAFATDSAIEAISNKGMFVVVEGRKKYVEFPKGTSPQRAQSDVLEVVLDPRIGDGPYDAPPGYVRQGDGYVFKGDAKAQPTAPTRPPSVIDRVEQAARDDLNELRKSTTLGANKPIGMAADYVIIGAAKFARGTVKFAEWSAEMVREFGEAIKPYLRELYASARKVAQGKYQTDDQFRAAAQAAGVPLAKTLGSRNLSLMSREESVRKSFAMVDASMEAQGYPKPETVAQWDAAAEVKYRERPDEVYQKVVAGQIDAADPVNQRLIMRAISDRGHQDLVSGNQQRIERAITAEVNTRLQGTQIARAMAARVDPLRTPAERLRVDLETALMAPSTSDLQAMRTATDPQKQAIIRRQAARVAKTLESLRRMGIDMSNLSEGDLLNRRRLSQIMREIQTSKSSLADREFEFWRNSILSALVTNVRNIVGNTANGFYEYAMKRPVMAAINAATGNRIKGGTTAADLASIYKTFFKGNTWVGAWRNAVDSFITEQPISGGTKVEEKGVAIPGMTGRVIRAPQRTLLAADEYAKSLIVQAEVQAQAMRMGREQRLTGPQLERYVQDQVSMPGSDAWGAAMDQATDITFQRQPGALGKNVLRLRSESGPLPWVLRHIMPFVTTPVNIAKTGLRRTILGSPQFLASTMPKAIRGQVSPEFALGRGAEQLIAWGTAAVLYGIVNDKDEKGAPSRITGSAPKQRQAKDLMYRTAPPQSIHIGGKWYSYANIEPLATSLSTVVDLMQDDGRGMMDRTWRILTGVVRDKTFLRGLSDILDLIESENPARLDAYTANFASSYMPNLIRSSLRAMDDKVRNFMIEDPKNHWGDWWKRTGQKMVPYAEMMPPPRVDLFGREIRREGLTGGPASDFLFRLVSPASVQAAPSIQNIDRMILNWNAQHPDDHKYPGLPSATYVIKGETKRMTDDQYHEFLRIRGEYVAGRSQALKWDFSNPTLAQMESMYRIFGDATQYAKRQMGIGRGTGTGSGYRIPTPSIGRLTLK